MSRAPLRRERLLYTPVPGFSRFGAVFFALFAAVSFVAGAMEREWTLVLPGVGFLVLATLLWLQARWNKRNPEMHARVREAGLSQQAKHPVRQVVVSAVILALALPFLVWDRVWGLDGSPSVPVLVVAGVVGAAGGAAIGAWSVRHSRRLVGRSGEEALPESNDEAKGATTAMVALSLSIVALLQIAPLFGSVAALLLARRARRLSDRPSTRKTARAAVVCAWVGLAVTVALILLVVVAVSRGAT